MTAVLAWLAWVWAYAKLIPVRFVVYAVLLLVGFFAGCSCARGADIEPPLQIILKASVRVDVPQGGGVTHSGSGTVVGAYIDKDGQAACIVLTNRHVCPNGNCPVRVIWPWNTFAADARWLGCDDRADLAALCCYAPDDLAICPPAAAPPVTGEILHQVGYPRTKGPVIRRGPALKWDGSQSAGCMTFLADVRSAEGSPVLNGDSGSGLFNGRGELVAVNWGGWGQVGSPCHAVHLQDVRRFLGGRLKLAKLFPGMPEVCPVHGEACPCGCRTGAGGTCNCARPVVFAAPCSN